MEHRIMLLFLFILACVLSPSSAKSKTHCKSCPEPKHVEHYLAKGCKPKYHEGCPGCIKKYSCPKVKLDSKHCFYQGKKIPINYNMLRFSPCEKCRCEASHLTNRAPVMACLPNECPEYFIPQNTGSSSGNSSSSVKCFLQHDLKKCCGKSKCLPIKEYNKLPQCSVDGQNYKIGELYPTKDRCHECVCDPKSSKKSKKPKCRRKFCYLDMEKLHQGCVPVYSEGFCCPLRYICPPPSKSTRKRHCRLKKDPGNCDLALTRYHYDHKAGKCHKFTYTGCGGNMNNFEFPNECMEYCSPKQHRKMKPKSSQCHFDGINYKKGRPGPSFPSEPDVTCKCLIPPELTCVISQSKKLPANRPRSLWWPS